MSAISISNLRKYYGGQLGIEDITFEVNAGEIFGFVGPNGAGKSTTIKILFNFIYPSGGSASICGLDAVTDSKKIKSFTGYVPSEVRFHPDFKVSDILNFNGRFYGEDQKNELERLCGVFEVDRTKRFRALSMGNKKKVSIICALVSRPKVLVLDEPTNRLDPMMQKALFAELKQQTAGGAAVLLSSHNLSDVQEYCDRAGFIKKGKMIAVANLMDAVPQKIVTVTGCKVALPDSVQLLERDGEKTTFRSDAGSAQLLELIGKLEPRDFTVENESIENRFMKLYGEEDAQ